MLTSYHATEQYYSLLHMYYQYTMNYRSMNTLVNCWAIYSNKCIFLQQTYIVEKLNCRWWYEAKQSRP